MILDCKLSGVVETGKHIHPANSMYTYRHTWSTILKSYTLICSVGAEKCERLDVTEGCPLKLLFTQQPRKSNCHINKHPPPPPHQKKNLTFLYPDPLLSLPPFWHAFLEKQVRSFVAED